MDSSHLETYLLTFKFLAQSSPILPSRREISPGPSSGVREREVKYVLISTRPGDNTDIFVSRFSEIRTISTRFHLDFIYVGGFVKVTTVLILPEQSRKL